MNRNERYTIFILLALFLIGAILWTLRSCSRPVPISKPITTPLSISTAPVTLSPSSATVTATKGQVVPVSTPPKKSPESIKLPATPQTSATGAPLPPKLELHKELIPKDINIIRCYYQQEIVPPGTTLGFDIDGSGFTQEFEQMIKVDAGEAGIKVKNLRLVTANQIHGEMEISPEAATAFVFPRVLIKNLPVFSAPDPYAVIRKSDVLTILFISMEDNGHAGRFRILTNLDEDLFKQFHIVPSTGGLDISDITPRLPYAVEGKLRIGQRLPPGEYGLTIQIGAKTALRREGMIRIVKPNVGSTGFVQLVMAADPYHRPGDAIQLYIQGSGFIPENIQDLNGHVNEFDMGPASFTYINGGQMRLVFHAPANVPPGSYGLTIQNTQGQKLYEKTDVFKIVEPDWIAGVQVTPPVKAGGKSTLRLVGRDLSTELAQSLKIELDEPGISISSLKRQDGSTLTADITVSSPVASGDYWLHLSAHGKKITPPFGSIIKVEAP